MSFVSEVDELRRKLQAVVDDFHSSTGSVFPVEIDTNNIDISSVGDKRTCKTLVAVSVAYTSDQ